MNKSSTRLRDGNKDADAGQSRLLLSPREAAKALSICEKTLWNLTQTGQIPVLRIGRAVRYPVDGLKKWIAEQSKTKA